MQRKIIALLSIVVFFAAGLYSCKKDNINGDKKDLIQGTYLTLKKSINSNLDFSNPAATVSEAVGKYGLDVQSVNIYVATGDALDTKTWKLIKNVPFADSTLLVVSTAEIAAALAPATIQAGNQYVLQNEAVTKSGDKYSAGNTPTNFTSFPAYNFAFSWNATAICPFSAATSAGSYKVVTDTWVDYSVGAPITVTAGPGANQISYIMYPGPAAGGTNIVPTVVDVDPATGAATVKLQTTGYYGSATPGNLVKVSGSGYVFSCTGAINLKMTINVGGSDYSGYVWTIKK